MLFSVTPLITAVFLLSLQGIFFHESLQLYFMTMQFTSGGLGIKLRTRIAPPENLQPWLAKARALSPGIPAIPRRYQDEPLWKLQDPPKKLYLSEESHPEPAFPGQASGTRSSGDS